MWSLIFVLLSYLDRNLVKGQFLSKPLNTENEISGRFYMLNGTFCARNTHVAGNYLHQVSDGVVEVRTLRDLAGKLVDCSVTRKQMEVKSFMHVCRLGLKDQRGRPADSERSLIGVAEAKSNCQAFLRRSKRVRRGVAPSSSGTRRPGEGEKGRVTEETGRALHRIKRGFTYPGTLWCGAGNIADNYNQLGEFAATDSCCRVHDHCPYVVQAFSSNFGYTNFKWHSISHCDCDDALKECLRKVNDTPSRVVGQAFFNVIEVPCFTFDYEKRCVERHWYGLCKRYDKVPIAVLRKSVPYDFGGIDVIDVLPIPPSVQKVPESGQEDKAESTGRPSVSGSQAAPEEPSIGIMVTAAEDFIKVLATVSTSQSSTAEAVEKEAHRGDKKKKKVERKRKKKKKDKGQRKKQRLHGLPKPEETSAVTPSGHRAQEAINNSFVNNSTYVERKKNTLARSVLDLEILPNKLVEEELQRRLGDGIDGTTASVTKVKPESSELGQQFDTPTASSVSPQRRPKMRKSKGRQRRGKKRKRTPTPAPESSLCTVLQGEPETDRGGSTGTRRTFSSTSLPAKRLIIERHTETGCLTKQLIKAQRQKPEAKKRRKNTSSSDPSVEQFAVDIPTTDTPKTASKYSLPLPTIDIETAGQLESQKSEMSTEKAPLSTAAGTLSIEPQKTKRLKHRGKRGQNDSRRIAATSPFTHFPVTGRPQTTPNPNLPQPWLSWVHRLLEGLGGTA